MQQVFEFLEDISASLTNMADRELTILKDLKVQKCSVDLGWTVIFFNCTILWCFVLVSEKRGRRCPFWNRGSVVLHKDISRAAL